ncbi:MAG: N-acetylmuramoyl-L-alanine amidase [Parachlamydiales bacterium]|nr:N-acetylmuramoyl-L-alanine amidase [Parachlamydiales bacterium]
MRSLIFLTPVLLSFSCFSHDYKQFDSYQNKISKETIQYRIDHYLQNDPQINNHYELDEDKFFVYSTVENKLNNRPLYVLKLGKDEKITPLIGLKGKKIAIDPGHFGGNLAYLEERFVNMQEPYNVSFNEGTLTLCTALFLKKMLEDAGSTVMLTKEKLSEGVYPENFFLWLQSQSHLWKKSTQLNQLFRDYYNRLDLKSRAQKINDWQPDIAIIIHYNAYDDRLPNSSKTKATDVNCNMVFIPGAFSKKEIEDVDGLFHFTRLLIEPTIEKSKALADALITSFSKTLDVLVPDDSINAPYLKKVCIQANPGVYCRNLILTRLVKCPLAYGETLVQNNSKECLLLADTSLEIEGIKTSARVREVAQSYFIGIQHYFGDVDN